MIFLKTDFISHAGNQLDFKIECDSLCISDWMTIAYVVHKKLSFRGVYGIPRGGVVFAECLEKYIECDKNLPFLIVDDVFTTGMSMEVARKDLQKSNVTGVVLFARNKPPLWIQPIFQLWE